MLGGLITVFLAAASLALVLLLSAGLSRAYQALIEGPWPVVEEIEIKGLRRMERREVLDALGVPRNANVFALRLSELPGRLEPLPWVRSATVRLDPPGRIVVEIVEREALLMAHAGEFHLVDSEGRLFVAASPEKFPGLLLVTGFSKLKTGERIPPEAWDSLRELLLALEANQDWLPLQAVSECHWEGRRGFVLYMTANAMPVRLGTKDFATKLARLKRVFALLSERQLMDLATAVDLDYPSRAFVAGNFPGPKGI